MVATSPTKELLRAIGGPLDGEAVSVEPGRPWYVLPADWDESAVRTACYRRVPVRVPVSRSFFRRHATMEFLVHESLSAQEAIERLRLRP